MDDIAFLIKTIDRPKMLHRILTSIRKFYPEVLVIVGDDSEEPYPEVSAQFENVVHLELPPDIGCSAGRNRLLEAALDREKPLFALFDDNNVVSRCTQIELMRVNLLEHPVDLVAGFFYKSYPKGVIEAYEGFFAWDEHHAHLRLSKPKGIGDAKLRHCLIEVDCTQQFFVANTQDILDMGGWSEKYKTKEHEDFFLKLRKSGRRAAICPWSGVLHRREHAVHGRDEEYEGILNIKNEIEDRKKLYESRRGRGSYRNMWKKDWGAEKFSVRGTPYSAEDYVRRVLTKHKINFRSGSAKMPFVSLDAETLDEDRRPPLQINPVPLIFVPKDQEAINESVSPSESDMHKPLGSIVPPENPDFSDGALCSPPNSPKRNLLLV